MDDDSGAPTRGGKAGTKRRGRGFTQAAALIAPQMQSAAARRGFVQARLKALWPEIAGAEFAAITQPVKITLARGPIGGILTLGVAAAHGPQVQMGLPVLRDRINRAMGPGTVGRIQLVQAGSFEAQAPAPAPPPAGPPPDLGPLRREISSIGDENLRSDLETLARNVLSRRSTPKQTGS